MRFLFFLLLGFSLPANALDLTGDGGKQIQLNQPAQRIISLAPHITELLFAAGAGDKVIGVVEYSNFPEAAKKIPRIGSHNKLDLERIISLQPDLIVAWSIRSTASDISKLKKLGMKVFYIEPRSLPDIAIMLEQLGKLAGTEQQARKAADTFKQHYLLLKEKYQGKKILRAFYQIWDKPLMTINGTHLISDVMRLCGLQNVFADIPNLVPRVNEEAVIEKNPEIIIAGGMAKYNPEWADQWQRWSHLSATRLDALIDINPDIIQRHSPRILEGAAELCEKAEKVRSRVTH